MAFTYINIFSQRILARYCVVLQENAHLSDSNVKKVSSTEQPEDGLRTEQRRRVI